jgi:iron complex transport system permease protein
MFALYVQFLIHGAENYQRGGILTETLPAILGAVATLGVVYFLSQRRGWLDPVSLILIGVIVATMCGAIMLLLQSLVPTGLRGQFIAWVMGHIHEAPDPWTLWTAAAITIIGSLVSLRLGRAMDAATLSDAEAHSVGVSVKQLRLWLFVLAGVLTAATVSLAGPIGFVGLVAPHAARLLLGPRHTPLVVGAALCGIILVVGSDVLRQVTDLGAGRVPIGVITALIGGPAFLWLLLSGKGQS